VHAAFEDTQLTLVFIANNSTAKFDEIKNDSHVNVSFCDTTTTSWASCVFSR
jgi:general stress protein 26